MTTKCPALPVIQEINKFSSNVSEYKKDFEPTTDVILSMTSKMMRVLILMRKDLGYDTNISEGALFDMMFTDKFLQGTR